jgi:4-amino-4-deoxy-L-arabinose transferase-like glycosyltransferase
LLSLPLWWDAVGCYLPQANLYGSLGLDWHAYAQVGFVRAPVYPVTMALVLRIFGAHVAALHVATLAWCALAPAASLAIARRLTDDAGAPIIAAALCLLAPTFVAQVTLVQTDLPAAALMALAWAALLDGRRRRFVALSLVAVWTKESTYYLCLPAAWWLWSEARARGASVGASLAAGVPAIAPGLGLLAWMVLHRALTGHFVHPDHQAVLGGRAFAAALLHNWIEFGRVALVAVAAVALVPAAARMTRGAVAASTRDRAIVATGLLVALLPFAFPAGLPRYMLPSLPPLAALAAVGLTRWRWRTAGTVVLALLLVACWWGPSLHENPPHHLEGNLAYLSVLDAQADAAREAEALGPARVAAAFPMVSIAAAPPEAGYLRAPLVVAATNDGCAADLFLETSDEASAALRERLERRARLDVIEEWVVPLGWWAPPWGRQPLFVRLSRLRCAF